MTLNCWVRGQEIGRVFPVSISSKETVGTLKKIIKDENSVDLRDIDANALALYKVSIPWGEGDHLADILDNHTIASLGKPLQSMKSLSASFTPPPADDQIHLVIGM